MKNIRRLKQVCEYGWKDALVLSQEKGVKKGIMSIFIDIISCFLQYNVWSNQYKKEKLHLLSGEQKKQICLKYQESNTQRDRWVNCFFDNYKFAKKWGSLKYETSADLQKKRDQAYKKHFGFGDKCFVSYGVIINTHHYADSIIKAGDNLHIAEDCVIDYSGNIIIGNNVILSEGTKIITHNHTMDYLSRSDLSHGAIFTPLTIQDRASTGARVIIMPGVEEIGRGAMISAGAVVRKKVPPYAIVMGNPSRVVGFRYTPDQILELEEEEYPIEERLSEEVLNENYKKYYLDKLQEIKQFLG